jgi:glycosidase
MNAEKKPGIKDVVFGPQIRPENRVATHIRNRIGARHLHRRSPAIANPDSPVELTVTTSGPLPFEEVACWYRFGDLGEVRLEFSSEAIEWDDVRWDYVHVWSAAVPGAPPGTVVTYRVGARIAGSERWVYADNQAENPEEASVFAYSIDGFPPPDWARTARVYHIFVDRFAPDPGLTWSGTTDLRTVHGGTLKGVIDRLDYIHALGFNAIWLSPIFASPSHHGYDATDLFLVEPRLGTNADLEDLFRRAHNLGIRILLDFVPNHWSDRHPTFEHARKHPDSPFRAWYHWDAWPDTYRSFFDVRTMPKINLSAGSPARDHVLEAARFWLQRGADGYRVDHAEGPEADFWPGFRRTCLEARPEAWLFGEVGRSPDVMRTYAGELHGNLDFNMARALRRTFALGDWPLSEFAAFLQGHLRFFPAEFLAPTFLDNHDMNRFLFLAGGNRARLRLAALLIYTLPGPPVVYYGTERGLSQPRGNDEGVGLDEARQPVDWTDESSAELQEYFANLNALRDQLEPFAGSEHTVLVLDDERELYAYRRKGASGRVYVVAINAGREPATVYLPDSGGGSFTEILGRSPVRAEGGRLKVDLAPESGAVLTAGDR